MRLSHLSRTREDIIMDTVITIVLALIFFLTAYPFFLAIVLSFNEGLDAARGGIYFWPRSFTLENYVAFFRDERWIRGFFVSVTRTFIGTIVTTLFTALVAYGLSFEKLMFRKFYLGLLVLCMYFHGGLIPYYITLRMLGLLNSFWVYIIPQALSLFFVIVAISFFREIPQELYESAKLDGAGELTVLLKVYLPLSLPLLATIAIFSGVAHWNAWFDSAFFVMDNNLRPMAFLLMEVINRSNVNTALSAMAAAAPGGMRITPMSTQVTAMVISVVPIMFIYPFLQKYFVTGLTLGSVKG